jgi:hypothetical protein
MKIFIMVASMLLASCATTPSAITVKVPVPVECKETVPERPLMPLERLQAKPTLDQWIQAADAEIERREAYEIQLRAALVACTAPVTPTTGAPP